VRLARGSRRGLALLGLLAGCAGGEARRPEAPRLSVHWSGADTAEFGAPATAEWCRPLGLIEIRAIAGDTGVGIAIFRREGAEPGSYVIRRPELAETSAAAASLALRWFSRTAVQGFQGDSGVLSLRRAADSTLSGRFTAAAQAITGTGRLRLAGSFGGIRVLPATRGCVARRTGDSGAGVH